MKEWYTSMTVLEQVYFWIAAVASVLLIVQIILLIVSFGGGDLDADGDFDMDGDADTDGGLSVFTIKGLVAFFALGGWCGFATASFLPGNIWAPILVSVAAGMIALLGVGFALKGISKLQCEGTLETEKLVGKQANVYVSIPANRGGRGKITLTAQGRYMEIDAVTEGDRLSVDEAVVIVGYTDDYAVVERAGKEVPPDKKPTV